jgi:hypothetical protein
MVVDGGEIELLEERGRHQAGSQATGTGPGDGTAALFAALAAAGDAGHAGGTEEGIDVALVGPPASTAQRAVVEVNRGGEERASERIVRAFGVFLLDTLPLRWLVAQSEKPLTAFVFADDGTSLLRSVHRANG